MKGPLDFAELCLSGRVLLDRSLFSPDEAIDREADAALKQHRLERQPGEIIGEYLILPCEADGQPWRGRGTPCRGYIQVSPLYSAVRPDEALAGVRANIAAIASLHGPGRVWFLLSPVHLIDYEGQVAGGILDGQSVGILRTFYGHEKQIRVK